MAKTAEQIKESQKEIGKFNYDDVAEVTIIKQDEAKLLKVGQKLKVHTSVAKLYKELGLIK